MSLVYDEMKIDAKLDNSNGSGRSRGFIESGSINDEVEAFQRGMLDTDEPRQMATHINVFMVRGPFSHSKYAFVIMQHKALQVPNSTRL